MNSTDFNLKLSTISKINNLVVVLCVASENYECGTLGNALLHLHCHIVVLELNIYNNAVLVAAEPQMSASRKTQQKPLSPQEETQMSKCVIDRLVSIIVVLYCPPYQ